MNIQIGIIAGLVCMLSWGTADFFAVIASRKIGHLKTLFWVYSIAVILGLIYSLFNPQNLNISINGLIILILVGFLQATALMFFYKGLEIGTVSVVSPIASSYSLIVVLLGLLILKEQLNLTQIISISLIIVGVPLVSINISEIKKIGNKIFKKGTKESFIAMISWGFSYFFLAPVIKENSWFWATIISMIFIILFLFIYGIVFKINFFKDIQNAIFPIFSDGLCTIVGYLAYSYGVLYSLVSLVTPISTIFPVVTIILAIIFFKEKLFWNQVFGIACIIGGLVLLSI
ncbi:MAG: DMT family transporter [Candidatus Gottesmanbacteria bacterium]